MYRRKCKKTSCNNSATMYKMRHHLGVNAWDAFVTTTLGREVPRGIENDTSQVIACVMLPEAGWPVVDWTPADEIAALPGVDEVVVTCRAGRTSGYRHSSAGSGYVVFHADESLSAPIWNICVHY